MPDSEERRKILRQLWDRNKNDVAFETISVNTRKAYWWRCVADGHSFDAPPGNLKYLESCPYAAGRRVLRGFNDLESQMPEIAAHWNKRRNTAPPSEYVKSSNRSVWWQCPSGHEFEAPIGRMTFQGFGCAVCSGQKIQIGFNDLQTANPSLAKQWHPEKNEPLAPKDVTAGSKRKVWWRCSKEHEWAASVQSRNKGTGCPFCAYQLVWPGFNDLASQNVAIANEWNREKNNEGPESFLLTSSKKAWWLCTKGHAWQAVISSRTGSGTHGCPTCAGLRPDRGKTDLGTKFPQIAKRLHRKPDSPIDAGEISPTTHKKYEWDCPKGHIYVASVGSQTRGGGCPYCAGKQVLKGFNDFASRFPHFAKLWDSGKNKVGADEVSFGSFKKFWFICSKGHGFQATPSSFAKRKEFEGCSVCAGRVVQRGFNDLETRLPSVAALWHPTKNAPLQPDQVTRASTRKVWWQCRKDPRHEWLDSVASRSRGAGCPVCVNKVVIAGVNDLETEFPDLAADWHPTKNEPLAPTMFSGYSAKKVTWLCRNDDRHEWVAQIDSRRKRGCPYCSNQRTASGVNDLGTTHPHLAAEFIPERNSIEVSAINAGSHTVRWWRCENCASEWRASPANRTRVGSGCPKCARPGYDPTSLGYIYLLSKETLGLQQFGITNVPEKRLGTHQKNGWEVLDIKGPADGYWVVDTEMALKAYFRDKGLLLPIDYSDKFDGFTESWSSADLTYQSLAGLFADLREWEK